MAKYQAYAEYKDSGVEWLGEIPNDWINTKVKYEAYVKARVGWHGLKSDDFTDEGPYLVTGSDFKGTNIDWSQCYHCDLPRYEQDPYIQLKDGDLLITKDGTIGKVALVSNLKDDEKATLNSGIFVVRPLRNNFSTKFYFWLLQSKVFKEFVDFNKTGSTIVHLYQDTFVNFEYASPVLEDQIKISNFLDHETTKIDHLIEKQQQLIELLKEKRQAVISHAVTKGLNPNVKMKDSGVEWLGEVPEHWDVSKFAYLKQVLTDYTANGSFADLKANVQYLDEPSFARLVRLTDLRKDLANTDGVWVNKKSYEYLKKSALYGGEFLLANVGAYAGLFYQMPFDKGYASLAPNMFMAKFNQSKVSREFMAYVGQSIPVSSQLRLSATASSAQPKLNKDDFKAVRFVYPGLKEQQKIVDYLDQELKQIDILLKKQEQAISLMQERRTALISAAVTGKIDVRNWQSPTVAEADTELSA